MAFVSDDVLCSYDDVTNQDPFNGKRSDPSAMGFHESRMGRPLISVYGQLNGYPGEEIISVVEKCMKKFVDNLLWHLDGISERMSQLEIHCYKLQRAIGDFRSDMLRNQNGVDTKLKSLEKNLQEVHISLQILRGKKEHVENHKELTNRQLAPKESDTCTQSHKGEGAIAVSPVFEPEEHDNIPELPNPRSTLSRPPERYVVHQSVPIYPHQSQPLQPELPCVQVQPRTQIQYPPIRSPSPPQQQIQVASQTQQPQLFPQNPQQFTQHIVSATHQLPLQTLILRPQTPPTYTLYTRQPISRETFADGGSASAVNVPSQTQQQARIQSYVSVAPYPPKPNIQSFSMVYGIDGSRVQSCQTYQHPSNSGSLHHLQTQQMMHPNANPNSNMMRSHADGEGAEKDVSMGYPREQVVAVVNRMVESGQPVGFNALPDRMSYRPQARSG